jgi:hypothetical protein
MWLVYLLFVELCLQKYFLLNCKYGVKASYCHNFLHCDCILVLDLWPDLLDSLI